MQGELCGFENTPMKRKPIRVILAMAMAANVAIPFTVMPDTLEDMGDETGVLPVFTDITSSVFLNGMPGSEGNNTAAWADFDNDGWVDLFDGSALWRNDRGEFHQVAGVPLNDPMGHGTWGDFDNDGFVDLSVGTRLYRNNGNGTLTDVSARMLPPLPPTDATANVWGDFDNDGYLDLYVAGGQVTSEYFADVILFNKKGLAFTKGWQDPAPRSGRSALTADFDRDGDLDVYVSNYRLGANYLFCNNGRGAFTDMAGEYGADGGGGHSIGSAWGDMDNDGHLDLFAGNFSHPGQPPSLFLRNGGPEGEYTFQVMSRLDGPDWRESYAAPALGDIDNDGDLDLFLTTVYGGDRGRLYRNEGSWRFVNATAGSGLNPNTGGQQASWADFDNDGDLDLITGASAGVPGRLYRNNGNNNTWLKVKVEGGGRINRSAIGSQVRVVAGDHVQVAQDEAASGRGGNANDPALHFGLGRHSGMLKVDVLWPDGMVTMINSTPNQTLTVRKENP